MEQQFLIETAGRISKLWQNLKNYSLKKEVTKAAFLPFKQRDNTL